MEKIRVLVVDNSALMRKLVSHLLSRDPEIEVVGTAMDGLFALKKIERLQPDVVTLDIDMPRMDGLTTLKAIIEEFGIPVILVSSLTEKGALLTLQALEMGAVDFVTKPPGIPSLRLEKVADELIRKVKACSSTSLRRFPRVIEAGAGPKMEEAIRIAERVVAIGVSTGGPQALSLLLPSLPPDFPAGVLIVQHMPEGFTEMFARRLDQLSKIEVKEAKEGDLILPGRALIAPGNRHLKVRKLRLSPVASITGGPEVNGHRPSADVLFSSVAQEFGPKAIGVIMTGMGEDGAEGIGKIRAAGGATLAQSEDSCVIFGMPKAAIERGYVQRVVPLEHLAASLADLVQDPRP